LLSTEIQGYFTGILPGGGCIFCHWEILPTLCPVSKGLAGRYVLGFTACKLPVMEHGNNSKKDKTPYNKHTTPRSKDVGKKSRSEPFS